MTSKAVYFLGVLLPIAVFGSPSDTAVQEQPRSAKEFASSYRVNGRAASAGALGTQQVRRARPQSKELQRAKALVARGAGLQADASHSQRLLLAQSGSLVSVMPGRIAVESAGSGPAQPSIAIEFAGALPGTWESEGQTYPTYSFIGSDPSNWRREVKSYSSIRQRNIYPSVDIRYYAAGGKLEYDLIAAPGADLSRIRMVPKGSARLELGPGGELTARSAGVCLSQSRPRGYQVSAAGLRQPVEISFALLPDGSAGFRLGEYDHARQLVIDPVVTVGGYVGGSGLDEVNGIAFDKDGNLIVAGSTTSTDFKSTPGAFASPQGDVYVQKMKGDGSAVIWRAVLGGTKTEYVNGMTVDAQGAIYVVGETDSPDLPVTRGAPQSTLRGTEDGFVAKILPDGSTLAYLTYLGGSEADYLLSISVNGDGVAAVTGNTASDDFPSASTGTQMATMGGAPGAIVARIDAAGKALLSSVVYGGNGFVEGEQILTLADGSIAVAGRTSASDLYALKAWQPNHRSAGLWHSATGASTWTASADGMRGLEVYDIAMDPSNSQILYSCTARGIFKSTDGGATWNPSSSGLPNPNIQNLTIDPKTPSTLYAGSLGSGLYKSTNSGASWSLAGAGLVRNPWAVAIDPQNPKTLYMSSGDIGLYKSTDGGDNWTEIDTGFDYPMIFGLAVDPKTPTTVYAAAYMGVYRSVDGGMNWARLNVGPTRDFYYAIAVSPGNPSVLLASSVINGCYRSTNGGDSWQTMNDGLPISLMVYSFAIQPGDGRTGYAATTGGIYTSLNAGQTWLPASSSLDESTFYKVIADPADFASVFTGGKLLADGFVALFAKDGRTLKQASYLGGEMAEEISAMAADKAGNIYLAGSTASKDFPIVADTWQSSIAGDYDAFLAKIDAEDGSLAYSALIGGSSVDGALALLVDDRGTATVGGITISPDFPVTDETGGTSELRLDIFLSRMSTIAPFFRVTTRWGGNDWDELWGMATGPDGSLWIGGSTKSTDLPAGLGGMEQTFRGGVDGFVARVTGLAAAVSIIPESLTFEIPQGGEEAVESKNLTVSSTSGILPLLIQVPEGSPWLTAKQDPEVPGTIHVTANAAGMELGEHHARMSVAAPLAGVAPIEVPVTLTVKASTPPTLTTDGVLNAADLLPGAVSPGLAVRIRGTGFHSGQRVSAPVSPGILPVRLGSTRVLMNGVVAPLEWVDETELAAIVPYGVDGSEIVTVIVERDGLASEAVEVPAYPTAPGLFTLDGSGSGQALAWNEDYTQSTESNPAARGRPIILRATGEGVTDPPGIDGKIALDSWPAPLATVEVLIGGLPCDVYYAAAAPQLPAGYLLLNLKVPDDAPEGSAVPVVLRIGGRESRATVTLALK